MKTEQDLFHDVTEAIIAVLHIKAEEIRKESRLVADLGAESIDFLDISYELEKRGHCEIDLKKIIKSSLSPVLENRGIKQEISVGDIVCFLKNERT